MKKIVLLFMLTICLVLAGCSKYPYKNEVEFKVFYDGLKNDLKDSIITDNLKYDFIYNMDVKEYYESKSKSHLISSIVHDEELKFCMWVDLNKETKIEEQMYIHQLDTGLNIYKLENGEMNVSGAYTNFENFIKLNVIKNFNYSFIPVNATTYLDIKDDKNIYTIVYDIVDTYIQTIQFVVTDNYISKYVLTDYSNYSLNKELIKRIEFHEFKLSDNDLNKEYNIVLK